MSQIERQSVKFQREANECRLQNRQGEAAGFRYIALKTKIRTVGMRTAVRAAGRAEKQCLPRGRRQFYNLEQLAISA